MKKVLVIDDAVDSRSTLRKLLTSNNISVIEAIDGNEGWQKIIKEHPDLIFLDLYMPNKDGFEILRDIQEEWLGVPVVVISGDDNTNTIEACLEYGAKAYLKKPISNVDIQKVINI